MSDSIPSPTDDPAAEFVRLLNQAADMPADDPRVSQWEAHWDHIIRG